MFSLTCRETGIPASARLRIKDEVLGLDIDNAVTLRLLRWDTQVQKTFAKRIAMATWGGKEEDDVLNATTLHPLAQDDPYADENTIIS